MAGLILVMRHNALCRLVSDSRCFLFNGTSSPFRLLHKSSINYEIIRDLDKRRNHIMRLKSRDRVSAEFELIYKAPMEGTIRLGYGALVFFSLTLFGAVIYRRMSNDRLVTVNPQSVGNLKFLNPELEVYFFSFGLMAMIIAATSLMFKYPFRVYKHCKRKEYIGLYISPFLPVLRQVKFTSVYPAKFKNPLYALMEGNHYVLNNSKRSFFMSHCFRVPKDLTDMLDKSKQISV